eukprot:CAMPEP_0184379214 /NCGR_PEP_ID=MMETSP0007-20130409/3657_1 /TAXON_ID=97485 /ORGANISM="Prymnesium parvum, Strain Texoma1" /LENGTH=159 /DNA_ID=CAMNT_0026723785 /DNA_START=70 /DNA_END=550 /DNA_ORIENTATION=+
MNVRQKWIPELRFYCPTAEIVLVGCKSDLADDPLTLRRLHDNGKLSVDEAAARQLACEHGASFVRCSALKRQGLKEVFDTAIAKTLEATQGLHPNKRGRAMSRGVFSLLRSVSPWRIVTANSALDAERRQCSAAIQRQYEETVDFAAPRCHQQAPPNET